MNYLANNWQVIAEEFKNNQLLQLPVRPIRRSQYWQDLDKLHISNEWVGGFFNHHNWLNFGLIYQQQPLSSARQVVPKTIEILEKVSQTKKIIMAGFSWLRPGTNIPIHTDTNPGCLTYHLGLIVPDNCGLFTKNRMIWHQNGQLIAFDSNQPHSAINYSKEDRVILYMLVEGTEESEYLV